jgi:hypothetical protein
LPRCFVSSVWFVSVRLISVRFGSVRFDFLGVMGDIWVAGVDQDACPEPKDGGCTGGAAVRTLSHSYRLHDNARAT